MARHAKTDSDVTSLAASTPPRSPSRGRPAYYVLSPAASHPDVVHLGASGRGGAAEKMSLAGSTPAESPLHYHFHRHSGAVAGGGGGGVQYHSRESCTGRLLFSDQLRSGSGDVAAVVSVPWRRECRGRRGRGRVPPRRLSAAAVAVLRAWGARVRRRVRLLPPRAVGRQQVLQASRRRQERGVRVVPHPRRDGPDGRSDEDDVGERHGAAELPQPRHLLQPPRHRHAVPPLLRRAHRRLR